LNVGQQHRLGSDIEHALDQHRVVPGRPDNRGGGAALQRLQLCEQDRHFIGGMLGVEQNPVEPGIGDDLGADVTGKAAPQTDLQAALLERLLENVAIEFHRA